MRREICLLLLVKKNWSWELTSSWNLTLTVPHIFLHRTLPLSATINSQAAPSLSSPLAHFSFYKIAWHYSRQGHYFSLYGIFPLDYKKRKRKFGS